MTISLFILVNLTLFPALSETTQGNNEINTGFIYSVRYGMGGFSESRSAEGSLGGGEIAFDIRWPQWPISVSISQENYTNSADPTQPYEIARMVTVSAFYCDNLINFDKVYYFLGLGAGKLSVPRSETTPKPYVSSSYINIASRVHYQVSQHFSLYAHIKYLNASKTVNDVELIDYNDTIFLLGIGYDFQL